MGYQPYTPSLASKNFVSDLESFARELHEHAADSDKAFLQDLARGRYPMIALQRLMAIAAQSPNPRHHEVLPELVRPRVAAPCFVEANKCETLSTGPADVAQMAFIVAPCKSTAQRLRDALLQQMGTTKALYQSLMSHSVWH